MAYRNVKSSIGLALLIVASIVGIIFMLLDNIYSKPVLSMAKVLGHRYNPPYTTTHTTYNHSTERWESETRHHPEEYILEIYVDYIKTSKSLHVNKHRYYLFKDGEEVIARGGIGYYSGLFWFYGVEKMKKGEQQ